MSQDEMVVKTGIPKRSYVNYENEKSDIPLSKLQNIANVLKVGIEELLSPKEKPEPTNLEIKEPGLNYDNATLQSVKEEIQQDLNQLAAGMTKNFSVLSDAMFESLKGQQKVLDFIEKLDADKISKATWNLEEFLKSK